MFDPKKYDKTNSSEKKESFMDKREQLLKYLSEHKHIMVKECEYLEEKIEANPEADYVKPFKVKLDGWSRMLNGLDILTNKYEIV